MNAEQLRDWLSATIDWRSPDIPVWLEIEGRVYEIGRLRASSGHIILEAGEEEELSK